MIIILFSIFRAQEVPSFFEIIGGMIILLFVLTTFFNIINLITWPISKKNIYFKHNVIKYNNKTLNIIEIDRIYFELGEIGKTSYSPCCLSLYKNNIIEISIPHVSFIFLIIILLRCRHIKKRLMPNFIPILFIVVYTVTLLIYFIYTIGAKLI